MQFSAKKPLQRVQRAGGHSVDLIRAVQPRYPGRAAPRTPDMLAEMERVLARNEVFVLAIPAFINSHITESFKKRPVNAFETATSANPALPHRRLYTAIAKHVQ